MNQDFPQLQLPRDPGSGASRIVVPPHTAVELPREGRWANPPPDVEQLRCLAVLRELEELPDGAARERFRRCNGSLRYVGLAEGTRDGKRLRFLDAFQFYCKRCGRGRIVVCPQVAKSHGSALELRKG